MRVDPKTASRWAADGKFSPDVAFKTPGNHWRFRKEGVAEMFFNSGLDAEVAHGPSETHAAAGP